MRKEYTQPSHTHRPVRLWGFYDRGNAKFSLRKAEILRDIERRGQMQRDSPSISVEMGAAEDMSSLVWLVQKEIYWR